MKKKWSNQDILDDAKRFNTRGEWQANSKTKYVIAIQRGLLAECCEHMTRPRKAKGTWNRKSILESAKAFNSKTEWRRAFPGAYQKASRLGIVASNATEGPDVQAMLDELADNTVHVVLRAETPSDGQVARSTLPGCHNCCTPPRLQASQLLAQVARQKRKRA